MAIPDYQTIMYPLLEYLADGSIRHNAECTQSMANYFGLSDVERHEMQPSGQQSIIHNRVGWALSSLFQAGLVSRPQRGRVQISPHGMEVVSDPGVQRVDRSFLLQIPKYVEHETRRRENRTAAEQTAVDATRASADNSLTPEEKLESGYQELRDNLAQDLLNQIKAAPPAFFEQLVVDLLVAMGYGGSRRDAGQAVGRSGDGGIDGVINEDRLGLDRVYIQAKRWENPVGRPHVQGFSGSLDGHGASKGVLITTSSFTHEAEDYTKRILKRIILIDGERLAELMMDFDVGVTTVASYPVKHVDSDYFDGA